VNGLSRILRSRRALIAGGIVVAVVGVAAGFALLGGDSDRASSATTRATTSTTSTTVAPKPGGVIAPLTGLRDLTSGAARRPALTIKIDNHADALPQIGIDQADIVFEEVVEGGITRLLAVFQSHVPEVVGPVRSVRRTDRGVVTPIGGLFVYSGGAPSSVESIRTAPVKLVDESSAGAAMFRDSSRDSPHNLFGRPEALFAIGGTPVPPPPMFAYRGSRAKVPGVSVSALTVDFSRPVSFEWDAKQKRWNRSIYGAPAVDPAGVRQAPHNVVVLFVDYEGGAGVEGSEAQLVGEGDAVVFTAGRRIDARWLRPDLAVATRLRDAAGAVVRLTPGQTWVALAPIGTAITAE